MNRSRNRWLDTRICNLVKPPEMSLEEYKVTCSLNGIDATITSGPYLHWVMVGTGEPDIVEAVHKCIVGGLKKKDLLDLGDHSLCRYFCDALVDLVTRDQEFLTEILEAVLTFYNADMEQEAPIFMFCKNLNKSIGLTTIEYFG